MDGVELLKPCGLYVHWWRLIDRRFWGGYCVRWSKDYKNYSNHVSYMKAVTDDYGELVPV